MLQSSRRYVDERLAVLGALGMASAVCVALELLCELRFHDAGSRALLWNLTLAWVPLLLALTVYHRFKRGARALSLVPVVALWLLFLPNAPYILSDFIHLSPTAATPLWLEGAILSAFASTGLLLGFVSIYLLHAVARQCLGPRGAWCGVVVVLGLTSIGVYVGRFLRWNSWDLLVRPSQRLAQLMPALDNPSGFARATAAMILLTLLLGAAYFSFYVLVGVRLQPRPAALASEDDSRVHWPRSQPR